jgi:mannose-6-phosphate isomerase-like protein (cupin superfamily)
MAEHAPAPIVIRPEERIGVRTAAGDDVYATLATGAETHGGYFLTHSIVPPGGGPPAHIHTREEEAFFLLRGELVFLLGDEEVTVPAGTFLNVPRGTKHRFRNDAAVEAEMIFWFAPAGIEGLFEELAAHPEEILAIGERYGVEYFLDE